MPLLLIYGASDAIVKPDQAAQVWAAASVRRRISPSAGSESSNDDTDASGARITARVASKNITGCDYTIARTPTKQCHVERSETTLCWPRTIVEVR